MKLVLEIPDNKASAFIEVLKSISFVKIKSSSEEVTKSNLFNEIKEGVEEVNLIKQGKLKGIPVNQLLDEL